MTTPADLGPLEMEVLGLLDAAQPMAVAEVQRRLEQGGRALAYTTVMTVLVRLQDKGVVTRKREGARFLYAPARRAPGVARGIMTRIQQSLFRGDRTRPILTLLEDEELSIEELQAVRDLVDAKLGERR